MVKLLFNPCLEQTDTVIESKSSKKIIIDLNPFRNLDISSDEQPEKELLSTKNIIGLENCHYTIKEWYNESLNNASKKFLLLIGPIGCGKTTLVESFCREENILLYSIKIN